MTSDDNGKRKPIPVPGREADARPLPRRFYKEVGLGPSGDGGYAVLLDGRPAKTPGKRLLRLTSARLAEAVAGEWGTQAETIDPAKMPLTRLVNTALDGVAERMGDVAADVVKYAGSDLLCYRAETPPGLVRRQAELWDPLLLWIAETHGVRLTVNTGIMHVAQPAASLERLAAAVAPLDALPLTALHVMTTLMGSAVLALATLQERLPPETAWEAAHVDEDWQMAEWGQDAEALARRHHRWQEMQAASALSRLASL
ncbi:MAG: ATPase [Proteobacteria bacterium]|nr:ATPase [Pseudomonadota bacterium]